MLWQVDGNRYGDVLGSVASAVDVNGDGVADVLVGAPSNGAGEAIVLGQSGRFAMLDGKTGATLVGARSVVDENRATDALGASLVGLGRASAANRALIAVGAPAFASSTGDEVGMASVWSCGL